MRHVSDLEPFTGATKDINVHNYELVVSLKVVSLIQVYNVLETCMDLCL
jgi:hypothetical protein